MNSIEYKKYLWQQGNWPEWNIDVRSLSALLAKVNLARGRLLGSMQALGFQSAAEATLRMLTQDVVKSSEIEGEQLNQESVRSSLARRLGLETAGTAPADRNVEGIVEMVLDATRNYEKPLTSERLFGWHAALFPTGYSGMTKIQVGAYRTDADGPMQVVSGGYGREKVHYVAPPAGHLVQEMVHFLTWFNSQDNLDPLLKAGLAHFWLVTIHPFEDGNGRISRAVCDMALARADGTHQRFYSLSAQIQQERENYYTELEHAQKGTMDITAWMGWFLACLLRSVKVAEVQLQAVLTKGRLWSHWSGVALNERQVKMLNMLLDGFEGHLNNRKWASLNHCSGDTALRDIKQLVEYGILLPAAAGGRSTHYLLAGLPVEPEHSLYVAL